MAPPRHVDRLQPALLDRLTDDAPGQRDKPPEQRVIGRQRLRELVLRDLAWLFNTAAPADDALQALPQARRSVLAYGLPPLAGQTASSIDPPALEARVRRAILEHEPRILPATLKVEAVVSELQLNHYNQIGFRISGQLWAQPVPLELLLHTEVDLETGRVQVRDLGR